MLQETDCLLSTLVRIYPLTVGDCVDNSSFTISICSIKSFALVG